MADYLRTKGIWLIVVLALTGRVAAAGAKAPAEGHAVQGADDQAAAPLVLQALD